MSQMRPRKGLYVKRGSSILPRQLEFAASVFTKFWCNSTNLSWRYCCTKHHGTELLNSSKLARVLALPLGDKKD